MFCCGIFIGRRVCIGWGGGGSVLDGLVGGSVLDGLVGGSVLDGLMGGSLLDGLVSM